MKSDRSAIVFDLAVIINALANRKSIKPKAIGEFCWKNIYEEISKQSKRCARVDVVTDWSPNGINLKEMTQYRRGIGMHVEFDNNTPFPIDFANDFLKRSENKFYPYLVELILQKYQFHNKIVVATKNIKVITNLEDSLAEVETSDSSQPEADSRTILHVSNCIQIGLINFYVRTNDTDVVVLLIVFMPDFLKIKDGAQVIAIRGVGTHKHYMSINVIAESVTLERCKELLFLHALSGSDYTSSFFHARKVKWLARTLM